MPNERPKIKPENKKDNLDDNGVPLQRPISARERPFEAYVAEKEAREHRYDPRLFLCLVFSRS